MANQQTAFDLDAANLAISSAIISMVTSAFRDPSAPPDTASSEQLVTNIRNALTSGAQACAEVKRLRDDITTMRDQHRPQPSADPQVPEPRCNTCSLTGVIVTWPCEPWSAAEQLLTHNQH